MILPLLVLAQAQSAQKMEIDIQPTDDVWVYQHAENQAVDEFLRAWGDGESSTPAKAEDYTAISWSALSFDLSKMPKKKLKKAVLVLWAFGQAGYDAAISKKFPLEVRPCPSAFKEDGFQFIDADKVLPKSGADQILGQVSPKPSSDATDFAVEIDLLKGKANFNDYFAKCRDSETHRMGLALSTAMDPSFAGDSTIYKFYSRNADKGKCPTIVMQFED